MKGVNALLDKEQLNKFASLYEEKIKPAIMENREQFNQLSDNAKLFIEKLNEREEIE